MGFTAADRKKGIHTIEAKEQSMCYGYQRLKLLYQDRENIDLPYYEEAGTAPRSSRYASTLALVTPEHQPFINNPLDDDQQQLDEIRHSADDSGEIVMNDNVQRTGSQGMQHAEEQDGDDDDDDDVGDEREDGNYPMSKRHFIAAYDAQAAKRYKIDVKRSYRKRKTEACV